MSGLKNHTITSKPIYGTATCGFKMHSRLFMVLVKLDKALSTVKLWTETLHRKKKKIVEEIWNKIGPNIEPCGTPDVIVWKLLFLQLIFTHLLPVFQV